MFAKHIPSQKLPLWFLKNPPQAELLRRVAAPISLPDISTELFQQRLDDMVLTMYKSQGIGLAAPQIGLSLRLAVIAPEVDPALTKPLMLINPVIEAPSAEQDSHEEGCLSVPKVFGSVRRATQLKLKALDRDGQPYQLQAEGLLARVIQHEVDHLNGRLFLDRADAITSGHKFLP